MIRNEVEYKEAVDRLTAEKQRLKEHRAQLVKTGYKKSEVKVVMDPLISFHKQLAEEVSCYESLKRGVLAELSNLKDLGGLLIKARIASNITQRELADRLKVSESQVSRDERNEYHGVTIERAAKVLSAMGIQLSMQPRLPQKDLANR